MKNKKVRRLLAGMLATTMILGSSMMSFAADSVSGNGIGTGTGSFEGHVDSKVISVTLPTYTNEFNYIVDPEGLIAETEGAKYTDKTFEEGASVYFLSGEDKYTNESKVLKVINKGTHAVDVTITAKTAENTKVAMSNTATFQSNDTAAKVYLGLHVADQAAKAVTTSADAAKVIVGLAGRPENFEVQYDETQAKYVFGKKADVADTAWNSFGFYLDGVANTYGDWSAASLGASDVTVTWAFAERASDSANPLAPTTAHAEWDTSTYDIWFALDNGDGGLEEASKLTACTLANKGGTAETVTPAVSDGWAKLTYAQFEEVAEWVDGEEVTLAFTYDGKKYQATLVME